MSGSPDGTKLTASVLLAALAAVVLWGASPVATKLAVTGLPPIPVAVLRTLIGGFGALALALAMRLPLPSTARQRGTLALSGFAGFIAFPVLFTLGLAATTANRASIILAMLPVLTGAYAHALERHWPAVRWWIGCAIAVAGEVLLIAWRAPHASTVAIAGPTLWGDALVVLSTLFAATGYVAGARLKQLGYPSTAATFWGAAASAIATVPALPWLLADVDLAAAPGLAWAGVLYLAVAVTIVGYVLWYWALGKGGIARVGLMQFLQPVSGLLLAALLLGEGLTLPLAIAAALVLTGVFVAARTG
jgi:drug/metabolite transporter (DMT)-like permease